MSWEQLHRATRKEVKICHILTISWFIADTHASIEKLLICLTRFLIIVSPNPRNSQNKGSFAKDLKSLRLREFHGFLFGDDSGAETTRKSMSVAF